MRKIAILCGRYLPGFKDGGPLRTLINICDCLGKEYNFKIITNDRDHGDLVAYKDIVYNAPNYVGNAEVWYLKPGGFTFSAIKKLTEDVDEIYCFGPYDDYAYKTMILKRLGKIKKPLVIASMGTFSEGAIKIKSTKKKLFLTVCKFLGLFKKVVWSVTSTLEEQDVKKYVGKKAICYVAEDLPRSVPNFVKKNSNEPIKGIFVSRICKKKNLTFVLEILQKVNFEIDFDIYGVIEDKEYWTLCEKLMAKLPSNVHCCYKGIANSEKVIELFSEYDFFLFPTLGENYGHVIFESLCGGCLPIISDQTPWLDFNEKGIGAVLSLKDKKAFVDEIEKLSLISKEELKEKQKNANFYAIKKYESSVKDTGYRKIFEL